MRVLRAFAIALVVVAVAWTALWFAAAVWVEGEFEDRTAALAAEGEADVACGRHGVDGFPFRLRFVCDEDVMIETDRAGIALASIDAGLNVFSPSSLTATMEGPANVSLAPGMVLRANWERAGGEVSDLFDRRTIATAADVLRLEGPPGTLLMREGRTTLSPDGPDLRIETSANDVAVTLPGRGEAVIPAASADIKLEGLHQRLIQLGRSFDRRNGLKGTIQGVRIDAPGDGRLFVSGPFTVSPEGRISGRFTIAVRDGEALAALAEGLVDDTRRVGAFLSGFAALGQPREIEGEEMRALEIEANDGRVSFGLFGFDLPQVWEPPADG